MEYSMEITFNGRACRMSRAEIEAILDEHGYQLAAARELVKAVKNWDDAMAESEIAKQRYQTMFAALQMAIAAGLGEK